MSALDCTFSVVLFVISLSAVMMAYFGFVLYTCVLYKLLQHIKIEPSSKTNMWTGVRGHGVFGPRPTGPFLLNKPGAKCEPDTPSATYCHVCLWKECVHWALSSSLSLSLWHTAISLGVSCSKHLCSQLANKLWSILTWLDTILECMYAILAEAVFCQIHSTFYHAGCTTELHTTLTGVLETLCCLIFVIGGCMHYSHEATHTHTSDITADDGTLEWCHRCSIPSGTTSHPTAPQGL